MHAYFYTGYCLYTLIRMHKHLGIFIHTYVHTTLTTYRHCGSQVTDALFVTNACLGKTPCLIQTITILNTRVKDLNEAEVWKIDFACPSAEGGRCLFHVSLRFALGRCPFPNCRCLLPLGSLKPPRQVGELICPLAWAVMCLLSGGDRWLEKLSCSEAAWSYH